MATVFSIEEFTTYDGPGIRTSVFIKGCPLSCVWCHNPEGQNPCPEFMRSNQGCLGCGECVKHSQEENGKRILTAKSASACPKSLIKVCGIEYTAQTLVKKLEPMLKILNHNDGGITFSGGEPLFSPEFLYECLTLLKGKTHRAIQTTGYCDSATFKKILTECDFVLYDLKFIDGDKHEYYCGVDNELILANYEILAKSGVPFITRVPLIPGVNDTEVNLTATAKLLEDLGVENIELLPYNKLAGGKYGSLLREYKPDFDESQAPQTREEIFKEHGITVRVL
ncbi:MAG: glycyl-radical enzyme activating protein [Clostridia bacterium]|nr:glycyl-radical enzyme activating protein [Clostridia bacterium]